MKEKRDIKHASVQYCNNYSILNPLCIFSKTFCNNFKIIIIENGDDDFNDVAPLQFNSIGYEMRLVFKSFFSKTQPKI